MIYIPKNNLNEVFPNPDKPKILYSETHKMLQLKDQWK